MKPWELIAEQIHNAGWSYGYSQVIFAHIGDLYVVDAVREGQPRFVADGVTLEEAFSKLWKALQQASGVLL